MSHMRYFSFENTLIDLRNCWDALKDMGANIEELGNKEKIARKELIFLCQKIAYDFGENDEQTIELLNNP